MSSQRRFFLLSPVFCLLILSAASCQNSSSAVPTASQTNAHVADPAEEIPPGWYSVYFTSPEKPSSKSLRGGPDRDLAQAIRNARISVDVAVLQLNLWSIRDALIDAYRRGVSVRIVTESDHMDEKEIGELIEAGIPVVDDRREGLMHNKFVVIDRLEVWTGSMNFTVNDAYHNNNQMIRIRSDQLAHNFTTEFEEMFTDDKFGPGSPANTPYPLLMISGTRVESCFSPEDSCTDQLVSIIQSARTSIFFLAYSFTSNELAQALIEQARRGVRVAGVIETGQATTNRGTKWHSLLSSGVDVRLDNNPKQMHEKVMLIDGEIAVTGSFNFTYSAGTRNDENMLIIYDSHLAEIYLTEFERIFNDSKSGE